MKYTGFIVMKECIINKCTLDSPQWNIGLWSQCSKTCGPVSLKVKNIKSQSIKLLLIKGISTEKSPLSRCW